MKKTILINIMCISWVLSSCSSIDVESLDSNVILHEGEEKMVKIDQDSLAIKLVKVTPIFSEGVVEGDGTTTLHKIYDTDIEIDNQILTFRSSIISTDTLGRKEKTWEQLKDTYQGIKSYKSFQIGISDVYSEGNPDQGGKYISKVLIRK